MPQHRETIRKMEQDKIRRNLMEQRQSVRDSFQFRFEEVRPDEERARRPRVKDAGEQGWKKKLRQDNQSNLEELDPERQDFNSPDFGFPDPLNQQLQQYMNNFDNKNQIIDVFYDHVRRQPKYQRLNNLIQVRKNQLLEQEKIPKYTHEEQQVKEEESRTRPPYNVFNPITRTIGQKISTKQMEQIWTKSESMNIQNQIDIAKLHSLKSMVDQKQINELADQLNEIVQVDNGHLKDCQHHAKMSKEDLVFTNQGITATHQKVLVAQVHLAQNKLKKQQQFEARARNFLRVNSIMKTNRSESPFARENELFSVQLKQRFEQIYQDRQNSMKKQQKMNSRQRTFYKSDQRLQLQVPLQSNLNSDLVKISKFDKKQIRQNQIQTESIDSENLQNFNNKMKNHPNENGVVFQKENQDLIENANSQNYRFDYKLSKLKSGSKSQYIQNSVTNIKTHKNDDLAELSSQITFQIRKALKARNTRVEDLSNEKVELLKSLENNDLTQNYDKFFKILLDKDVFANSKIESNKELVESFKQFQLKYEKSDSEMKKQIFHRVRQNFKQLNPDRRLAESCSVNFISEQVLAGQQGAVGEGGSPNGEPDLVLLPRNILSEIEAPVKLTSSFSKNVKRLSQQIKPSSVQFSMPQFNQTNAEFYPPQFGNQSSNKDSKSSLRYVFKNRNTKQHLSQKTKKMAQSQSQLDIIGWQTENTMKSFNSGFSSANINQGSILPKLNSKFNQINSKLEKKNNKLYKNKINMS